MRLPDFLLGQSRERLVQGVVIGSLVTMTLGFGFGGLEFQRNAERRADLCVNAAVVAVLTPICVDNFRHASDAIVTLVALNATDSWHRDTFVEKDGWATFPGSKEPNRAVAEACAEMLCAKN